MSVRLVLGKALLVVISGRGLIGCESSVADKIVEETTAESFQIDASGTFSFRNATGDVQISGSDDLIMTVRTTRKAWSAEQLAEIAARVSVKTNAVSIETSYPPEKTWRFNHRSGSVNYVITLPRAVKILRLELENGNVVIEGMHRDTRAELVNGNLVARDCFGDVQLSVANGALDVFYENWAQRPLRVDSKIIGGNARIFLPRAASFHLVAEAANGNVSNHFGRPEERDARRATRINMSMGSPPQPEISVRAIQGDIDIAAAKAETRFVRAEAAGGAHP